MLHIDQMEKIIFKTFKTGSMNVIYHFESLFRDRNTLVISFFIASESRSVFCFFTGGKMAEWRGVMTRLRFFRD